MNSKLKYKKLRIAWSVVWGVVAVLLVALIVRSRNHFDDIGWATSAQAKLYISPKFEIFPLEGKVSRAETSQHFGGKVKTMRVSNAQVVPLSGTGPVIPYWPLVVVATLLAAVCWMPGRFSLRTLLVATTLVAVVLGMAVWMAS